MKVKLPFENPNWIYEGNDSAKFDKVTGRRANAAPKQIQANVEFLRELFVDTVARIEKIEFSGDGAIQSNHGNLYKIDKDIHTGTRFNLPDGFNVDTSIHDLVLTDTATGEHYHVPTHFKVLDRHTIELKTTLRRGQKMLIRVWLKDKKIYKEKITSKITARTPFPIPKEITYIPSVHEMIVILDGVIQEDYVIEKNSIIFNYDLDEHSSLCIISI